MMKNKITYVIFILIICFGTNVYSQYSVRYSLTLNDPNEVNVGLIEIRINDNLNNFFFNETILGNGVIDPPESRTFKGTETYNGLPTRIDFYSQNAFTEIDGPDVCSGINSVNIDLNLRGFFGPYTGDETDPTYFDCELTFDYGFIQLRKINELTQPVGDDRTLCDNEVVRISSGSGPIIRRVLYRTNLMSNFSTLESFSSDDYRNYVDVDLALLDLTNVTTINFQLDYGTVRSNIIIYDIFRCSPELTRNPTPIETNCSDSEDGSFIMQFKEALTNGDYIDAPLEEDDGVGGWRAVPPQVKIYPSDLNSNLEYFWPNDLPANRYRIRYQAYFNNGAQVGSASPYYEFEIIPPTAVTYSMSKNDISCASGQGTSNDGGITINASGGTGSYQYRINSGSWTTFSGGSVTVNRAAGNYTVEVQDSNGCTGTTTTTMPVEITQPNPLTINGSVVDAAFGSGNDGSVNITVSGGNSGVYTYSWTGPSFTSSSQNISGLAPGSYTVTVTDSKSCSASRSFTVGRYEFLSVNVSNLTCGNNASTDDDGSISARVQGGIANYRYDLLKRNAFNVYVSTGNVQTLSAAQTYTVSNLSEGFYRISVTDDTGSGRTITTDRTITAPAVFDFTALETDVTCNGGNNGTIALTITGGTAPYTTSWTGPNGFTSTNEDLSELYAGVYTLTLTDARGCTPVTTSSTVFINEPPTPVSINVLSFFSPSAGNTNGSISVEAQGGSGSYTYSWNTGQNSAAISGLADGIYTVIATDSDGCTASESITLEELDVTVSVTPGEEVLCNQDLGGLTANPVGGDGQYTYAWYNQNNPATILGTNSTISGLSDGGYYVTLRDTNGIGNTVTSATYTIASPPLLSVTNITTTDANCYGGGDGTITVTATGGSGTLFYSIDNGASYQASNSFTGLGEATYQIIVSDANGCITPVQTRTITGPPTPIQVSGVETQVTIFGQNTGVVDITVSGGNGGYSYSWTGPNGFTATTQDISNLVAGTYTVIVQDTRFGSTTDNSGCTLTQSFTITEPDLLEVSIDYENPSTDLKCNGDDNARLLATVTGGTTPYTYQWLKKNAVGVFVPLSDTSELLIGADAGEYRIDITDNAGATASAIFEVLQPDPLDISFIQTDINCFGEATGAIDITVTGGTAPYSYLWSNEETTEDVGGLIEGSYSVTVTDSLGCFETYSFNIQHSYEALQIDNLQLINVSAFEGSNGSISLNPIGGSGSYTIYWIRVSDNMIISNDPNIENLTADDYTIIIDDSLGCRFTQTFTITQPDIVEPLITSPTCVGGCDGSISILVNEGNGVFTYLWDTGDTTRTITNLCAGEYSVIITGYDNRILERTYIVSNPDQVTIDLGEDIVLCKDQSLTLDATVDDPIATYLWQSDNGFNATTAEVTLSESGSYTVFVTTALGCVSSDTLQITALDTEIGADFLVSSDLFIGEPFVIVDVSNPLPDLIQWNIPEGLTTIATDNGYAELVTDTPGDYQIQMTATLGACTKTFTKTITVREPAFDRDDQNKDGLLEFIIYPNPNQGEFSVNLEFASQTNIDIKLFSLVSNALLQHINLYDNKTYDIPFNLQGTLPSGIYFLMLQTPNKSYVRKIIVE